MSPSAVVVSQLGYPPVPEATPRVTGRVGWIPETVPVETVAHPVWWLEDSARLRRPGEDDDDYCGRIYFDLVGRGLIDSDERPVDVLWQMLQIDITDIDDRQRVEEWLTGARRDRALTMMLVSESPAGLSWAEREAVSVRPTLEEQLAVVVDNDMEATVAEVADAMDRFGGSTAEGVLEPLVEAMSTFLGTGQLTDRAAVGEAAQEVSESIKAALGFLNVLLDALGERAPAGWGGEEWRQELTEKVGAFYQRPGPDTADELWFTAMGQVSKVVDAGDGACRRLDGWRPEAPHRSRTSRVAGRSAKDIYGPPPVVLSAKALAPRAVS